MGNRVCTAKLCTNKTLYEYCKNHRCKYSGCKSFAANGEMCDIHTNKCGKSDCIKKIILDSKYCSNHTCSYGSCMNETDMYNNIYCKDHKCKQWLMCQGDINCSSHKCSKKGCDKMNSKYDNKYCKKHSCTKFMCYDEFIADSYTRCS